MRQVLVGDWAGEPAPEVQVRRRLPPPRGPLLFEGVGLLKGVLARAQAGETKVPVTRQWSRAGGQSWDVVPGRVLRQRWLSGVGHPWWV